VTSLRNTAMPLIRYAIGDLAVVPEEGGCPCGRGLPVFGRVIGRSNDFLRRPDGEPVTPSQVVDAVMTAADPGLVDLQVIQDGDRRLRALVVQRESPPPEPERERIAAALAGLVDPPEKPLIERVESIPVTPGGKVRTVISEEPVRVPVGS
jgi:phenylacetate-CoA ligase